VLRLGLLAGARHLVPFHHEPTRGDDALDLLGAEIQGEIAGKGSSMLSTVAREGWELEL
jgi:hypothetical protein